MIQAAMAFVLGLLVAGLLALLVTPAIWQRAMRLTRKRIEANLPLSRAEIEADKDQLRAGFAVSNRRLEMEAGKLRERLTNERISVSRRSEELASLTRARDELTESVKTLEVRVADLGGTLATTEAQLATTTAEVGLRDARIAEQEAALAAVRAELGAAQLMSEELRLEMVARQTEIGNLSDTLSEATITGKAVVAAKDQLSSDLEAERQRLVAEQKRFEALEASFAVLQVERTGRLADLERRTTELRAMEASIAGEREQRQQIAAEADGIRTERDQLASELTLRGDEINRLSIDLSETARRYEALQSQLEAAEAELAVTRAQAETDDMIRHADVVVADGDNLRKALAATEAEKTDLERRILALEGDLDVLRAENADLRRVSGAEWESDREENRRLRERLNEIAANVVRLTQSLGGGNVPGGSERPGQPMPRPASARAPVAAGGSGESGETTLAERLRALRHASRH